MFGYGDIPNELNWYSADKRNDEATDETVMAPLSIFWVVFALLIIVIGFNSMVAFMSANLSVGTKEDKLNDRIVPSNIMRYNLSRLQPRRAYWPVPISAIPFVAWVGCETVDWVKSVLAGEKEVEALSLEEDVGK